jgi:hypothetical protein
LLTHLRNTIFANIHRPRGTLAAFDLALAFHVKSGTFHVVNGVVRVILKGLGNS